MNELFQRVHTYGLSHGQALCVYSVVPVAAAFCGHGLFFVLYRACGFSLTPDRLGRALGYFERALVAFLVINGHIDSSLFIFAAKAAVLSFRLPGRGIEKRKQAVEYMLLGSFISYAVGLGFGMIGRFLLVI